MGNEKWEWRLQYQNKCSTEVVNCKQESIHVCKVAQVFDGSE